MAISPVISDISVDILKPKVDEIIYAKQHDRMSRKARVTVYANGSSYTFPIGSDIKYVVRAIKPDGTVCIYEKDENGNTAVTVSSTVLVAIAQQALAVPGNVKMEVCAMTSDETQILTTFSFTIKVEASAIGGSASTNYINPVIPTTFIKSASVSSDENTLTLYNQNNDPTAFSPSGSGGGGDIVWLTYDVTTFQEALELYNQKKLMCVKYEAPISYPNKSHGIFIISGGMSSASGGAIDTLYFYSNIAIHDAYAAQELRLTASGWSALT